MNAPHFANDPWQKNWVGNWGVVFCSWYGDIYTNTFQKSLGKKLHRTVLHYEKKASANYIPKSELDELCAYFVGQVEKDETTADSWCRQLKERTAHILVLMNALMRKEDVSLEDFQALSLAVHEHIPPNFAIKKVIDYLPPKLLEKHLPHFTEARRHCEPVYNKVEEVIRKWNGIISKKEKMPAELVACLTDEEMRKYLAAGTLPDENALMERNGGALLFYEDGQCRMFTGQEAHTIQEAMTKSQHEDMVKGKTAFPGFVRGTARIVFDPMKVKEFNEGDVLVTGMTRPEFLPLMKKAGGIVTDAGGILCHAAIVARELKKPCVVGTESATKVFKDGDLAELDAGRGTVRKLKGLFKSPQSRFLTMANEYEELKRLLDRPERISIGGKPLRSIVEDPQNSIVRQKHGESRDFVTWYRGGSEAPSITARPDLEHYKLVGIGQQLKNTGKHKLVVLAAPDREDQLVVSMELVSDPLLGVDQGRHSGFGLRVRIPLADYPKVKKLIDENPLRAAKFYLEAMAKHARCFVPQEHVRDVQNELG